MNTTDYLVGIVRKAADTVVQEWVTTLDVDDLTQDVWVELSSDDRLIEDFYMSDNPMAIARHLAKRCASKSVGSYEFHSGQYQYGTKEVRGILESGVLKTREFKTITEQTDLTIAMEKLRTRKERYAQDIADRFFWGNKDVESKRVTRAVDALTEEMNRVNTSRRFSHREGPGTRVIVSNSSALSRTRFDRE